MDPRRFVERILDDEALTDGLADPEGKLVLEWAVAVIERQVASASNNEEAAAITNTVRKRGRTISRCILAACEDEDTERTQQLLAELGHAGRSLPIGAERFQEVTRQLIEWEERTDA